MNESGNSGTLHDLIRNSSESVIKLRLRPGISLVTMEGSSDVLLLGL